ncbi:hypothetical protein [Paractinoplanes lichenicola]|uniref:Uncharacterized protein n=1 Tax=Paractinoplanes lichenicola TaxID=2802976 RepID=A0ABS1W5R4_9ACTN|nr:hypothetical protein [Actinoplanes lichenicola]MBL7262084.1 hypothetical protein [Actinoplanes lichenicola]
MRKRSVALVALALLTLLTTTAATPGNDGSRIELMVYSYGALLTFAGIVALVAKYFLKIVLTVVAASLLLLLYLSAKLAFETVAGWLQ